LRQISQNFDFDQNFYKAIDTIIEKLGTAKAYRVKQPKKIEPQKPSAGSFSSYLEPEKKSEPASSAEPEKKSEPVPTAASPTPTPMPVPEPEKKPESVPVAAVPTPEPEKPNLDFSSVGKLVESYRKVDDATKIKFIMAIYHHDVEKMSVEEIKKAYEKYTPSTELSDAEKKEMLDIGEHIISSLESTTIGKTEAEPGIMPNTTGNVPDLTPEQLVAKDTGDLNKYLKKKGLLQYIGRDKEIKTVGTPHSNARKKLVDFILSKKEHSINGLKLQERVDYFKTLLSSQKTLLPFSQD
jgi:hypothetical protein